MTKRKAKRRFDMMTLVPWSLVGGAAISVAGGVWYARDYIDTQLATKEEVRLAGGVANYTLNEQMEAVVAQIAFLERKANKTAGEIDQLRYLREKLQRMRELQKGK